jgi:N-acetylglutamate synthase-like GNAT family acetyltransferase
MAVRATRPQDIEALRAFVDRCSADTLYRRFHGAAPRAIERELGRIAASVDGHRSWVAIDGGEVRGTATLARSRTGVVEMALWVEDDWFRRGIGRSLVGALRAHARDRGIDTLVAWVQAENERALRFIRAVEPRAEVRFAGGPDLEVRMPVGTGGSRPNRDVAQEAA